MKISMQDARQRLAKAGFELGEVRNRSINHRTITSYQVTMPLGNDVYLDSREIVALLRDMRDKRTIPQTLHPYLDALLDTCRSAFG